MVTAAPSGRPGDVAQPRLADASATAGRRDILMSVHAIRTAPLRALILAIGLLAAAPAAAQAALNVTLVNGDALEDSPMTFVATGSTSDANGIFAKFRLAGATPCAPSFQADPGDILFIDDPSGTQETETRGEPGAYVVCAYLAAGETDPAIESFSLPVTVRANAPTLAMQAPARGISSTTIPVTVAGFSQVDRKVFARAKPAGTGPCGPSLASDSAAGSFAFDELVRSQFTLALLAGPFEGAGRYTLCAWVQESSDDAVAEAATSAFVDIAPPIPVLTELVISPSAFASLKSGGFTTNGLGYASIRYTLENTAASVRFTVEARRVGRRVGATCRTLTPANRRRKRCTRYQRIPGSYTAAGAEGTNYVRFTGRVGGRRLKRGAYRLSAAPRTTTGKGKTLRRAFRIVRG